MIFQETHCDQMKELLLIHGRKTIAINQSSAVLTGSLTFRTLYPDSLNGLTQSHRVDFNCLTVIAGKHASELGLAPAAINQLYPDTRPKFLG